MGKKKIYLVWIILVLLAMIMGSYAYFSWRTSESRLALTVGDINNIQVTLKPYRINAEMVPVSTYESESYVNVDVVNSSNKSKGFELYYSVNTIDQELRSNDFKYTITKSIDGGNTYSEVKTGNFSEAVDNTNIIIYNATVSGNTTEKYRVYVWLSNNGDQSNVSGASFNAELRAEFDSSSNIVVDVPDGLIPVVFDTSNGTVVKTVSSTDTSWYDYNSQEWANAVLVKESGTQTRTYYKNNPGVSIDESDILAYYVWIPRYSYMIWTTGTSDSGQEQTIEIKFESTDIISTGTQVGEYITHPAFWWDNNSNGVRDSGEELSGIWVGKFETTGTADEPTVLPDVTPLTTQSTSNQLKTSLKFAGGNLSSNGSISFSGNSTYGLTTNTNSHMMKNREWGAVAYLSHSKYGTNKEIYINNSSLHYTGRSGGNVSGNTSVKEVYTNQTSTELYNEYGYYTWDGFLLNYNTNTKSTTRNIAKVASTTGNITGIYDMSGGAVEYVMGVFANSSGQLWSGNSTSWNSDFTGLMGESGESHTGTAFPDSKYYDVYKASSGITIDGLTACNGGVCYGHALSETSLWYNDGYGFVSASQPWFVRGGNFDWGVGSGIFSFGGLGGDPGGNYGFRSVIVYDPTTQTATSPKISFGTNGNTKYANGNVSSTITVSNGSTELDSSTLKYIYSTSKTDTPTTSFTSGNTYTLEGATGIYYLIAKACNVDGLCTTEVSNPFYVDNTAPTLSLTKETYQEGFDGWTMPTGGSVSDDILTLSQSGTAYSGYYAINGERWHVSYDGYSKTASTSHDSTTGDAGKGDGGIMSGTEYFDANKASVKAQNGYTGNGHAPQLPLNTWSNNIKWNCYSSCSGTDIKYLRFRFSTGNSYSQPPIKIRNFKLWGQLYSNSFYNINISKSDDYGIRITKYAVGNQTESYFASNGIVITDDVIKVTDNNTYTVYVEDEAGNKKISTITIDRIDKVAPTGTISISFRNGTLEGTVSASDNISGVSSYMYALTTNSTCPTNGYTESTNSSYSFTISGSSTYYVCAKVKDNVGNISSAIRSSGYSNSSTVRINGAPGETITYTGASSGSITIGSTGYSTATLLNGTYKFTSNIAKSTSSTATDYSQSVTVSSNNQTINFYPSGAVYWFGNGVSDTSLYNKTGGITGNYIQTNSFYAYYYAYSTSVHGDIATIKKISLLNSSGTKYSKLKIMYETNEESKDYWCWKGSCYQKTNHLKIYDYSSGTELLNQMVSSVNTKSIYTVDLTSSTYSSISNIKFNAEVYAGNGYKVKLTIYAIWLE